MLRTLLKDFIVKLTVGWKKTHYIIIICLHITVSEEGTRESFYVPFNVPRFQTDTVNVMTRGVLSRKENIINDYEKFKNTLQ